MNELDMKSKDIISENIERIAELFPNVIVESVKGKSIDFDLLKQELSKEIVEANKEKYQLTWPGKKEAIVNANTPCNKTLRPLKEKAVDFENTKNIYIEGDNLEALKILQESYLEKIKCIYIDPPYNTGNDFIYNDNFEKNIREELETSGQIDEYNNRLITNSEFSGKYHSNWLTMMYSRLKLARNLIKEDGVIFISIDDNEVYNLKKICDEIFGEKNFVALLPWRKRTAKSDVPFGVSQDYEWIVCYAKTEKFKASVLGKERKYYETEDYPGRPWRIHDMTKQTTASERPNSFFTMINPKNGEEYLCDPNKTWRITKETFKKYYDNGEIVFPGDYEFLKITKPVMRYFKDNDIIKDGEDFGRVALSTKFPDNIGMSQDGTKELKELFENIVFPFPKPSTLIKYLINAVVKENDIILDFFSGSATTAHAVFQAEIENNINLRWILIQIPEMCEKDSEAEKNGYKTICDLGEERIRRSIKKIKDDTNSDIDYGFRVYKVDSSNMKDVYYKPNEIKQTQLDMFESNIKEDRSSEDLLTQVILDLGLTLDLKIEGKNILNNKIYFVDENSLIACFDNEININVVDEICKYNPLKVVFKDESFKFDNDKINLQERFKKLLPNTEICIL